MPTCPSRHWRVRNALLDSLHRLAEAQSRRPPDFLPGRVKTGSESIEATLRREDTRLSKCVIFGVWARAVCGARKKEWVEGFLDDFRPFDINADQWTTAAQVEGE